MKRVLIISLIALNTVLLAAILFGTATDPAHAQAGWGADYVMIPVMMDRNSTGMAIIDTAQQKLTAVRVDLKSQRDTVFRLGRQLDADFGSRPAAR